MKPPPQTAIITATAADVIQVPRSDLEQEHRLLVARLHVLRRILGYPALETGKEKRRQATQ